MAETRLFDPEAFGRRMKERREALGLTLEEVQGHVSRATEGVRGSSYGTLWKYEQGKAVDPRPNIVNAIARVLEVPFEWLMWEDGEPGVSHMVKWEDDWAEAFLRGVHLALEKHLGPRVMPTGRAVFIHAFHHLPHVPTPGFRQSQPLDVDTFARILAAPIRELEQRWQPMSFALIDDYVVNVAPALARVLQDHFRWTQPASPTTSTEESPDA